MSRVDNSLGKLAQHASASLPQVPTTSLRGDLPTTSGATCPIRWWHADWEEQAQNRRSDRTPLVKTIENLALNPDVVRIAVMPDAHEGSTVPNGTVVATRNLIYPRMVGADIGCGVAAIRFDFAADDARMADWELVLKAMQAAIPTLKHSRPLVAETLADACPPEKLSHTALVQKAKRDGRYQLGTLGRGNHFVELDRDEEGAVWAMVHSGSRAMGQILTDHHLARAQSAHQSGQPFLDLHELAGQDYWNDMQWALAYARENRLILLNRVADILERHFKARVVASSYLDGPHNFARRERHEGEWLLVHRKSANSALCDEPGLIPGSMGTQSRIVRGLGHPESLHSSAHGAGRALSRAKAFEKIALKDLQRSMKGIVFNEGAAAKLRDESPRAYKDLGEVMEAQKGLVRTVAVLKPLCVHKGI